MVSARIGHVLTIVATALLITDVVLAAVYAYVVYNYTSKNIANYATRVKSTAREIHDNVATSLSSQAETVTAYGNVYTAALQNAASIVTFSGGS